MKMKKGAGGHNKWDNTIDNYPGMTDQILINRKYKTRSIKE